MYLIYISQGKNFLTRKSMISLSRSISKSLERYIYIIIRKSRHQKDNKHFRRMNYLEGFDQKGDLQKVDLHEVPHPQSFFYTTHGSFLKVKLDKTISKRCNDKFEKLVDSTASFLLWKCSYFLRKKATYFSLQSQTSGSKSFGFKA